VKPLLLVLLLVVVVALAAGRALADGKAAAGAADTGPQTELQLPAPAEQLMLPASDPLVRAAGKLAGLDLDFALRITATARNVVLANAMTGSEPGSGWPREFVLPGARAAAVQYEDNLYVAAADTLRVVAHPLLVFRVVNGKPQIVHRYDLALGHWNELCLLNASREDKLDLIVCSVPGDPGGAVQVFTVEPDGELVSQLKTNLWAEHEAGQDWLDTAAGTLDVVDLDGDGRFELITAPYLDWNGPTCPLVFAWQPARRGWTACTTHYPQVIDREREFYRAYLLALLGGTAPGSPPLRGVAAGRPEFQWRGEWYPLREIEPDSIRVLLRDWDHSPFSGYPQRNGMTGIWGDKAR
jgi:hypothetical protein